MSVNTKQISLTEQASLDAVELLEALHTDTATIVRESNRLAEIFYLDADTEIRFANLAHLACNGFTIVGVRSFEGKPVIVVNMIDAMRKKMPKKYVSCSKCYASEELTADTVEFFGLNMDSIKVDSCPICENRV